jgi:hypothetical protein
VGTFLIIFGAARKPSMGGWEQQIVLIFAVQNQDSMTFAIEGATEFRARKPM